MHEISFGALSNGMKFFKGPKKESSHAEASSPWSADVPDVFSQELAAEALAIQRNDILTAFEAGGEIDPTTKFDTWGVSIGDNEYRGPNELDVEKPITATVDVETAQVVDAQAGFFLDAEELEFGQAGPSGQTSNDRQTSFAVISVEEVEEQAVQESATGQEVAPEAPKSLSRAVPASLDFAAYGLPEPIPSLV